MKFRFYISTFLQHLSFGLLIPTLVIWQVKNGLSFGSVGMIASIGMLTMFLSEIPSSYMADKWSKRGVIGIGYICLLASFGVLVSATNFSLFLVSQVLSSLALSILSGTEESFLSDIIPQNRLSRSISENSIADESGTLTGMLVAGIVLGLDVNIQQLYLVGWFIVLVAFINLITLKTDSGKNEFEREEYLQNNTIKVSLLVGLIFISSVISLRGEVLYQAQFLSFGLTLSFVSYMYLVTKTGSIFGSWAGVKMRNISSNTTIIYICLAAHVACFSVLLIGNLYVTVMSLFLFFFFENLYRNTMNIFLIESSSSESRTLNLSLVNAGNSLILIVATPAIGYVLDWSFRYAVFILVGIKVIGLCGITTHRLFRSN